MQVEAELATQREAEQHLRSEFERATAAKIEQDEEQAKIRQEMQAALDAQKKAQEEVLAKLAAAEQVRNIEQMHILVLT